MQKKIGAFQLSSIPACWTKDDETIAIKCRESLESLSKIQSHPNYLYINTSKEEKQAKHLVNLALRCERSLTSEIVKASKAFEKALDLPSGNYLSNSENKKALMSEIFHRYNYLANRITTEKTISNPDISQACSHFYKKRKNTLRAIHLINTQANSLKERIAKKLEEHEQNYLLAPFDTIKISPNNSSHN